MVRNTSVPAKLLIQLVSERPALWDKTSDDYKDRGMKENAWREISTCVNKNYENMPTIDRELFTRTIVKKWTHIRDSWVKSMKYGYDKITKIPPKPYVYHEELKFLQKILKCKPPRYYINMCQLSNMHFEEFYRDVNVNGNGTSQGADNSEETENEANFSIENLKQEPISGKNDSEVTIVNKAEDSDDIDDGWNLEDAETMSAMEEEKTNQTEPAKRKRKSIFMSSPIDDEYEEPKIASRAKTPVLQAQEHSRINYQRNDLYENRHWNFFMGILPSINGLDEDHILQFQSGVISLLQNLRKSQKQTPNPKSRCARSQISRRKPKQISDPIATEDDGSDKEYLSDK